MKSVKERLTNWIQKMKKKDPEKLREYWRKKKRKYRKKKRLEKKRQQNKEIEEQIKKGNINYNPNVKNQPFMTYREFKEENPEARFKDYMIKKIEHDSLQRLKRIPKARGKGFKWEGVDLWDSSEKEKDPISEHERELLEGMFSKPEFPESEKYDYEEAIEEEVRKHTKKEEENS